MSAEGFEVRTVTIDGHKVKISLHDDPHGIDPGTEYDCYSDDDLAAWRDGRWVFVIVKAQMPYGEEILGGVEYGTMGDNVRIGIDSIIESYGSDMVAEILANKPRPTGGEPFGTQVTMWSTHWGVRHALVTSSPKPEAERDLLDSKEWGIVLRPDRGGGGMTFCPAESLTLGWHPDGDPRPA